MFHFVKRGAVEYLEAMELSEQDFVTHAFCTARRGGKREAGNDLDVGEYSSNGERSILPNLNLVQRTFAIPDGRLILMRQVHGDRIRILDCSGSLPEGVSECDGLVTDRPEFALGVRTADCVPVLFADPIRRVVGAVHAGWRGTALGIAAQMVETMTGRFSSRREDILVLIGPAIGSCCYQVDTPVVDAFSAAHGTERFFSSCGEGRWMVDLALINRFQIGKAGVPLKNIICAGVCTACRQDLFFSHRAARGEPTGRQISLIMLRTAG